MKKRPAQGLIRKEGIPMRKDTLNKRQYVQTREQDTYHGGIWDESYAFRGWASNKYFTSDRYIALDSNFNRADGKPLKGYGIELEFESRFITGSNVITEVFDKTCAALFPADLFKYQSDSSLDSNASCEAITQVMTKEFIRNHYPEFKCMFDSYFNALGFSASRSGNCGMHVNISVGAFGASAGAQEAAVRKLFYIINRHYAVFCALLKRNPSRTHYCSQMRGWQDARTVDLHSFGSSHGVCLNLGHYDTGRVEIRLASGQKNFPQFRNTMEVIFHVVNAVKTLSWADCDKLEMIFFGCNAHVLDRIKDAYREALIDTETYDRIDAACTGEMYI